MNVKQAVAQAKHSISELFADESVFNIGLEEVEFDNAANTWAVTIGFSRPWDEQPRNTLAALTTPAGPKRAYKTVLISNDDTDQGHLPLSVKNRDTAQ
jgi:hypothetical protein